jgi:hypothetical protein
MMQRYFPKQKSNQSNKIKNINEEKNETKQKLIIEKQIFLDIMKKAIKEELLYGTQVLSLEEMKKINKIIKSSVITKAKKVENEAIIHIMNSFIRNILSEPKKVEKK